VSVCEKLLLTLKGPHPTLALPLVVEVWKWDWMSDVSPSISRTTFAARRKAENRPELGLRSIEKRGEECG